MYVCIVLQAAALQVQLGYLSMRVCMYVCMYVLQAAALQVQLEANGTPLTAFIVFDCSEEQSLSELMEWCACACLCVRVCVCACVCVCVCVY